MRGLLPLGAQILRPGGLTSPLDSISAPLYAAYGMRRLVTTWTGPIVTVRRSSDNATLDVYAAGDGWIDIAALLAWCGTASAYVTKWWDQSGSGRHADQTTASAQPMLVDSGAMITLGGRPAVRAPEGTYLLVSGSPPAATMSAIASVSAVTKTGSSPRRIFFFGGAADSSLRADVTLAYVYAGAYLIFNGISSATAYVLSTSVNGASSLIRANGTQVSGNAGTNAPATPMCLLGVAGTAIQSLDGVCGEIALVSTLLTSTQLRSIETQLGAPRGITIA